MSSAIVPLADESRALAGQAVNVDSLIERAATDPNFSVEKMHQLFELKMKVLAFDAKCAFDEAMSRLRPRFPSISKDGIIEVVKEGRVVAKTPYARFEDIQAVIQPLLAEEGFSTSFTTRAHGADKFETILKVSHVRGHSETTSVFLPDSEKSGFKNNVQAAGSAMAYGKRYAYEAAFDLRHGGQDTDGMDPERFKLLTEEQVRRIVGLLDVTKADRVKFLAVFRVATVAELTRGDYQRAVAELTAKVKKG